MYGRCSGGEKRKDGGHLKVALHITQSKPEGWEFVYE